MFIGKIQVAFRGLAYYFLVCFGSKICHNICESAKVFLCMTEELMSWEESIQLLLSFYFSVFLAVKDLYDVSEWHNIELG